jgi:hypothetical protein
LIGIHATQPVSHVLTASLSAEQQQQQHSVEHAEQATYIPQPVASFHCY